MSVTTGCRTESGGGPPFKRDARSIDIRDNLAFERNRTFLHGGAGFAFSGPRRGSSGSRSWGHSRDFGFPHFHHSDDRDDYDDGGDCSYNSIED